MNVLDAVYFMWMYSNTRFPTEAQFMELVLCRTIILAVHAAFEWRLMPTTFYACQHGIFYSYHDGGRYRFSQKG